MNRSAKNMTRKRSRDPLRWVSGPWTPWVRGGLFVSAVLMVGSVFLLIWHVSRDANVQGGAGMGAVELMVVADESHSSRASRDAGRDGFGDGFNDRIAMARYDLGAGELAGVGQTLAKPVVVSDGVDIRMGRRELTLDSAIRAKQAVFGVTREAGGVIVEDAEADDLRVSEYNTETPTYNGRPLRKVKTMKMKVTAYSPDEQSCGIWADGITASGYSVWTNGMKLVAADTKLLKFGTIITVPGYHDDRPVPVLDRGGKIKGHRLDVLYPSHEIALEWGVRDLEVDVWEYAD